MPKDMELMQKNLDAQKTPADKLYWAYLYYADLELTYRGDTYEKSKRAAYGFNESGDATEEEFDYQRELIPGIAAIEYKGNPPAAATLSAVYLQSKFMNAIDRKQHPALFDPSHRDHEKLDGGFADELDQYAKKLLRGMGPEGGKKTYDGEELAGLLEYGDHGKYLDKILEKTYARLHDERARQAFELPSASAASAAALKSATASAPRNTVFGPNTAGFAGSRTTM